MELSKALFIWPLYIALIIFIVFIFYTAVNVNERHYYVGEGENRQLYVAPHITLPGYETVYYPEQEVDLRKWVGSRYSSLKALNKDDSENLEATAGLALKATGLFTDYQLKEKDGHYILHRPERTERVFTTQAFYRIWWGKAVEN